jgi:hypothetical protein
VVRRVAYAGRYAAGRSLVRISPSQEKSPVSEALWQISVALWQISPWLCGRSLRVSVADLSVSLWPLSIPKCSDPHRVTVVDDRANRSRRNVPIVGKAGTWCHQPSDLTAIEIDERSARVDPSNGP